MNKRGIGIWLSSLLTALATAHLLDALNVMFHNAQTFMLRLYLLPSETIQTINPHSYLILSAHAAVIFWCMTCVTFFKSPIESFFSKILSEAKYENAAENQLLERKSEMLDAINETVELSHALISQIRDIICSVRAEVREIRNIRESIEKMENEIIQVKAELKSLKMRVFAVSF
ncbi:MAG: hypothetical protein RMK50_05385 [Nitrososphaerota archaeon]|nr:hypothetical protein [Candidatus Bathyarchaeota archaeon]MDW8194234.1 hypothetical protein [Nitrososphaerota archaeon]